MEEEREEMRRLVPNRVAPQGMYVLFTNHNKRHKGKKIKEKKRLGVFLSRVTPRFMDWGVMHLSVRSYLYFATQHVQASEPGHGNI